MGSLIKPQSELCHSEDPTRVIELAAEKMIPDLKLRLARFLRARNMTKKSVTPDADLADILEQDHNCILTVSLGQFWLYSDHYPVGRKGSPGQSALGVTLERFESECTPEEVTVMYYFSKQSAVNIFEGQIEKLRSMDGRYKMPGHEELIDRNSKELERYREQARALFDRFLEFHQAD